MALNTSTAFTPARTLAPAKINLHLRVGPRRDDGFHSLLSWMVTVGLFDTLTIAPLPAGTPWPATGVRLACSEPTVPCDGTNLVCKAAMELLRETGSSDLSADVRLDKAIPHGAGLGGGSSDAAKTLVALDQFWKLNLSRDRLSAAAAKLGSDVPFFLFGRSSVCTGRGEVVRPVAAPTLAKWVMLVLPGIVMPTPAVYRKFDEMRLGRDEDLVNEPDWAAWAKLGSRALLEQLVNDLEPPAFAISPQLGTLRADVERRVGRTVRMSGSGSSLFTLFDDRTEAIAKSDIVKQWFGVRVECVELAPEAFEI